MRDVVRRLRERLGGAVAEAPTTPTPDADVRASLAFCTKCGLRMTWTALTISYDAVTGDRQTELVWECVVLHEPAVNGTLPDRPRWRAVDGDAAAA